MNENGASGPCCLVSPPDMLEGKTHPTSTNNKMTRFPAMCHQTRCPETLLYRPYYRWGPADGPGERGRRPQVSAFASGTILATCGLHADHGAWPVERPPCGRLDEEAGHQLIYSPAND